MTFVCINVEVVSVRINSLIGASNYDERKDLNDRLGIEKRKQNLNNEKISFSEVLKDLKKNIYPKNT